MLTSLHIKNLALMEDASVELEKPSIALIGETGAGKSLIVESLSLLFGARADYSFVRDREKKASVSALFVLEEEFLSRFPHLQEVIEEDHTLLLERVLCPDKSSRYLINGQLYPLSQYRHIIDHLIDIHSQKSHSDILDEEKQLLYIDRYGKERLQKVKTQFQESYEKYQEAKKELKDFEEQNKELDTDYLSFQLEEIDRYQLKENEIEDLEEELRSIKDLTQVQNRYEELQEILSSSEPSLEEQLSQVERSLRSLMNAKPLEESAKDCLLSLRTFTSSLHNVKDMYESLAIDENRIDAINERLFSLKNLQRKYGKSSAEILKKRDDFAKKLAFAENFQAERERLENNVLVSKEKALKDAELLSKERERSCIGLTKDISKELEELGLRKNGFNARLTRVELNQEGIDNGLFFVSLNDGLEEESLKKAASGGETSRLLLALKSVLNNLNPYNCLIFDEIDTGVSGKQAGLVAKKISAISKISQTITISHSPQVVASQEQGILVYKQNENSTTKTHVRTLSEEEMIQELAKMLSSSEVSETALAQARTLRAELRKA